MNLAVEYGSRLRCTVYDLVCSFEVVSECVLGNDLWFGIVGRKSVWHCLAHQPKSVI